MRPAVASDLDEMGCPDSSTLVMDTNYWFCCLEKCANSLIARWIGFLSSGLNNNLVRSNGNGKPDIIAEFEPWNEAFDQFGCWNRMLVNDFWSITEPVDKFRTTSRKVIPGDKEYLLNTNSHFAKQLLDLRLYPNKTWNYFSKNPSIKSINLSVQTIATHLT